MGGAPSLGARIAGRDPSRALVVGLVGRIVDRVAHVVTGVAEVLADLVAGVADLVGEVLPSQLRLAFLASVSTSRPAFFMSSIPDSSWFGAPATRSRPPRAR